MSFLGQIFPWQTNSILIIPIPRFHLGYYSIEIGGLQLAAHSVGKCYAIHIEAEKTAFEQGRKHRQNGHKNPATSIVAAFADNGG